jgi:hypothetical protein
MNTKATGVTGEPIGYRLQRETVSIPFDREETPTDAGVIDTLPDVLDADSVGPDSRARPNAPQLRGRTKTGWDDDF